MVEMGVKDPDRPTVFLYKYLADRANTGKHGKISAAAGLLGMFGKPEGLAAEKPGIVIPQQNSRLFIAAIAFAPVSKNTVILEQGMQILPHCRQ